MFSETSMLMIAYNIENLVKTQAAKEKFFLKKNTVFSYLWGWQADKTVKKPTQHLFLCAAKVPPHCKVPILSSN